MRQLGSLFLLIGLLFSTLFYAQSEASSNAKYLKGPLNWRLEKVAIPYAFAPAMEIEGYKEVRFAPGMFDRDAPDYFTYAFVIHVTNNRNLSKQEIQQMFKQYYSGLSRAVADEKEKSLDFSKIDVELSLKEAPNTANKEYQANILFIDTFNSGEEVRLTMELEVIPDTNSNTLFLVSLVSPAKKENALWNTLYDVRKNISLPIN